MTPTPLTDDRLEAVLASIGAHLEIGDNAGVRDLARSPAPRRRARVLAAAAAVVLAVVLAVTAIAPARRAVADFLRIGSTRIDPAPVGAAPTTRAPGSTLPGLLDGLPRLDADAAAARLGRALPDTTTSALGAPDAIYAASAPGEGVVLAWNDRSTTLWLHRAPVDNAIIYAKQLGGTSRVEVLTGLGSSAVAITGPHTLRTPDRTIAAGNVVLWIQGGWELRLEADRPVDELTSIARTIR